MTRYYVVWNDNQDVRLKCPYCEGKVTISAHIECTTDCPLCEERILIKKTEEGAPHELEALKFHEEQYPNWPKNGEGTGFIDF